MEDRILGLHHITAIAGPAKRNLDFYTGVLGLRLLKKTVNFDDPKTYHFYYGDETGSPGTLLTFFPWGDVVPGRRGSQMATEIGYSVPAGSFEFWIRRFEQFNVTYNKPAEKFGEPYLTFLDPDGLKLELITAHHGDARSPNVSGEVSATVATRGFHVITLTLQDAGPTAEVLTEVFGYKLLGQHVNRYRYGTDAVATAALVDLVEVPGERRGHVAGGTIHHVAFRVKDDQVLMQYRDKVARRGLQITDKIDRNYFYSLYFREPGGVLFEIATDNPGFAVDEPVAELGTHLLLPPQYEPYRRDIEAALPKLD
jgi:glyoxalase family protein